MGTPLRERLRFPLSAIRRWWDAHPKVYGLILPWVTAVLFAIYAIRLLIKALS